jgi:hypothetical protein
MVIEARFFEDATSTNVGLASGWGIICRRSVAKAGAKRLAGHCVEGKAIKATNKPYKHLRAVEALERIGLA